MYTLLIGSVARNNFNKHSDIDICRIQCLTEIDRKPSWPNGPINYVDYTLEEFLKLYNGGSLFIFHILFEGILLYGSNKDWNKLQQNFIVKKSFSEELEKTFSQTSILCNIELFGNKFMTLYSNFFSVIKNFAIFHLANKGEYIFTKEGAIKKVFGDYYFELILDAHNYFEKGVINDKWNYDCQRTTEKILDYYIRKMREILNDY